jgi:hypothetical protein
MARIAVAVDDQPREPLMDEGRAERFAQRASHAGHADVPPDVARKLSFGKAKIR